MAAGAKSIVKPVDQVAAYRSWVMSRVHSTDTRPELYVRSRIHSAGFRYRLHDKSLPGSPDLVFKKYQLIVFVHGCFWHWHGCKRSRMPVSNRTYWEDKIAKNVKRDEANMALLRAANWTVFVVWECELDAGVQQVIAELQDRRKNFIA